MSLEAIKSVMQSESLIQERKAAAEAEARQLVANAEREGLALLQKVRADAAENGRELLKRAEEKAAQQAAKIAESAEAESTALKAAAEKRLDEAAELNGGRVVNH